jgi:flavin reductase (DIM6/NTAB) family NADH-FMN oxidoreductase RutF
MTDRQQIDPLQLRSAFGTFMTGVTVVTTRDFAGAEIGITANSFTSVSLEPPLVLVCVGDRSSSYPSFASAESFGVNVLREGQEEIANRFARRGEDRFATVQHTAGTVTGTPLLQDSAAWFECLVHAKVPAGDHLVLIGRVVAFNAVDVPPLGFWRGKYVVARDYFGSGGRAEPTVTAYLVDHCDQLLLKHDPKDGWRLPSAHRPRLGRTVRVEDMSILTTRPQDTFIYSIYEEGVGTPGVIVYRTRLDASTEGLSTIPDGSLRWFSFNELPWSDIASRALRAVLKRYLSDRKDGSFSVYVDSEVGGQVARLSGDLSSWASLALD